MEADQAVEWVCRFLEYFGTNEVKCKGTGEIRLDYRFCRLVTVLREDWGGPLYFNSCCRSFSHNKNAGGHPHSLHLTVNPKWSTLGTAACDVNWKVWSVDKKKQFALLARKTGLRVGLHDSFIHLDAGHEVGIKKGVFIYGTYTGDLQNELQ